MHPMPELIPMLKELRLSGVLDSLEQRNRQAIEQKLAYTDFLAMVVQDEVARRAQKKLALALRRASFRNHKTIEDFDFTFNPAINRALIMDLATCRFIEEKVSVFIVGPCGTGKSHLAQALGHCALRKGHDVLFTTKSTMLTRLNAARATDTYERQFNQFTKIGLLIVDDFGLKPLRPPQDEDLHDIVSERYERRSTIITSNLDLNEWGEAFPNRLLGAATIDRLRHGAYKIVLEGKSFRSPRDLPDTRKTPLSKPPKSTVEKGGKNS
jgi:DNA replication protein DnaC